MAFYERLADGITSPTLVLENKKMYGERLLPVRDGRAEQFFVTEEGDAFPLILLSLDPGTKADGIIITYGGMVRLAMGMARQLLIDEELLLDIVVVTQLAPCDSQCLVTATGSARAVFTLEEGSLRAGWGSMVISELAEKMPSKTYRRFGSADCVIPCGMELEAKVFPNNQDMMRSIKKACV
jgi:2-oxoisovalerate dehydrogenase E1 component